MSLTYKYIPDAPCREYLPTLGEKWPHSRGNVGKYSIHGAFGYIYIYIIYIYLYISPKMVVLVVIRILG